MKTTKRKKRQFAKTTSDVFRRILYARCEADLFRFQDGPMPWSHRSNPAPEAMPRPAPPPEPETPHINATLSAMQGNREAVAPIADAFATQTATLPVKPPKAPKPPKPKPVELPPLEPNEFGFHTSAIRNAMHEWRQEKGTPDQVLAHISGREGGKDEIKNTGLAEWLKDKKQVTRDDVLGFITPQEVKMSEDVLGGPSKAPEKWAVYRNGNVVAEFPSEEEADAHREELEAENEDSPEPREVWAIYDSNSGHEIEGGFDSEGEAESRRQEYDDDNMSDYLREVMRDFRVVEGDDNQEGGWFIDETLVNKLEKMYADKVDADLANRIAGWTIVDTGDGFKPQAPEGDPLHYRNRTMARHETKEQAEEAIWNHLRNDAMHESGFQKFLNKISETGNFSNEEDLRENFDEFMDKFFDLPPSEREEMFDQYKVEEEPRQEWLIRHPIRGRRGEVFDQIFDSEEEAEQALEDHRDVIEDWAIDHYESPYGVSSEEVESDGDDYDVRHVSTNERKPKYANYTVPGPKENYQELHVAVPGVKPIVRKKVDPRDYVAKRIESDPDLIAGPGEKIVAVYDKDGKEVDAMVLKEDVEDGVAANMFAMDRNQFVVDKPNWRDGHGGFEHVENPVVRIRHDDRKTVDGAKTFFIEEMQPPKYGSQVVVPDWLKDRFYEIGLKRALYKAAQGGYDKLAWTTGAQQLRHYDLRKHVDRIEFIPDSKGRHKDGEIIAYKDGRVVLRKAARRSVYPGEESDYSDSVAGYIGQGNADRLFANPVRVSDRGQVVYTLDNVASGREAMTDMEFGGHGLERLYDSMLGRKLKDIRAGGEKLGVKAAKDAIETSDRNPGKIAETSSSWDVLDGNGDLARQFPRTSEGFAEATNYLREHRDDLSASDQEDVWSVTITPELREKILRKGFSLYRRRGEPQKYAAPRVLRSKSDAPYSSLKKSPTRHLAGPEDVEQFIEQSQRLGETKLPVFFSIADRARNGDYYNPETGARFRAHGGRDFGIGDEREGKSGWASEMHVKSTINNGLRHSRGLWVPLTGKPELVLGSHGPTALSAEIKAAINNGLNERKAISWINDRLNGLGVPRVGSIEEFLETIRNPSRELIARSRSQNKFDFRQRVVKAIAPRHSYGHSAGAPFKLPGYHEMSRLLNYEGHEDDPIGTPAAVVYGDPEKGLTPTPPKSRGHHPFYAGQVPGINLGRAAHVPLHELLPQSAERFMNARKTNDPTHPQVVGDMFTSAFKVGKHHIDYDTARRLAHD